MKKTFGHVLVYVLIINFIFGSTLLLTNVQATFSEIDPTYGTAPKIDGVFNESVNEWGEAFKVNIALYNNLSQIAPGLPIEVWMMQSGSSLYVCLRFDLEPSSRSPTEFMGLLISDRIIEGEVNFSQNIYLDAKIIQFSNISNGDFNYKDYSINGTTYTEDSISNGEGAATLNGFTTVYEFMLPVNQTNKDVFLDYGEKYGFKIVYGVGPNYPDDIEKLNVVIVQINYPENPAPPGIWDIVRFVLSIIIFSGISAYLGLYTVKIVLLRKKVERYK